MTGDRGTYRDVTEHYASLACVYHEQYDAERLLEQKEYPANYFRLRILIKRLAETGKPRRLLDAGLGEATPALSLRAAFGTEISGFDTTPEMVETARRNVAAAGGDPARIIRADLDDFASFRALTADGPFDTVICLGVIPHVADEARALGNLRRCLAPGGRAFVSFRNPLFSLFTMNRLSHALIVDELLAGLPEELRDAAARDLAPRLEMGKPPRRAVNQTGGAGYDTLRARFHNPLMVGRLFEAAGFGAPRLHWYHYHPAPPYLEGGAIARADYRKAAMALEGEDSGWRGYFLCSAYMAEAVAA